MKKNLLLVSILVLAMGLIAADETLKLAVLGDPNPCDLLTAELSNDDSFELLDRSELEKVLREQSISSQNLTAGVLKKNFPHTDLFAVIQGKRLVVFNAKNGFRLWDGESDAPAKTLRYVKTKLGAAKTFYLSIVSVRDVGIPKRLRPKMEDFITRCEQLLVRHPSVQMLERSRLDAVGAERELTGITHTLAPSARLLTFEFEPGSEGDKINVKILLHTLDRRVIGRVTVEDCLGNYRADVAIDELWRKLSPQTSTASNKAEAAAFWKEYQTLRASAEKDSPRCNALLAAVLALDYHTPEYRAEELLSEGRRLCQVPWEKRPPEWEKQLARYLRFREEFPTWWKNGVFVNPTADFLLGGHFSNIPPSTELRALKRCGLLDHAESILTRVRAQTRKEQMAMIRCPAPEKIASYKDLELFFISMNPSPPYLKMKPYLTDRLQGALQFLTVAEQYLAKHPEDRARMENRLAQFGWAIINVSAACFLDDDRAGIIREHLHAPAATQYLALAEGSCMEIIRKDAAFLRLMRTLSESEGDPKVVAAQLSLFFTELDRKFPGSLDLQDKPTHHGNTGETAFDFCMADYCRFLTDGKTSYKKEKESWRKTHGKLNSWVQFEAAANRADPNKLLDFLPIMRKYNYERITMNRIANLYAGIAERLFQQNGSFLNSAAETLFTEANSAFVIQSKLYSQLLANDKLQFLEGAAQSGEELALLFRPYLLAFLRADGSVSKLFPTPLETFAGCDDVLRHSPAPIAFDGKFVALAEKNGTLHLFDRKQEKWITVPEFAPSSVISLAIHSDRIWALCGSASVANKEFFALVSCRLDGANKAIHFSTARADQRNELDSLTKIWKVNSLIPHGDSLLFTVSTDKAMIYRFTPANNQFEPVVKFPFTGHLIDRLWSQNGKIYCFTFSHGERIYEINPQTKTASLLFNQSAARYKFDSPDDKSVVIKGGWQMQAPFRYQDGMLYSAHYTPGAINLADPKQSPLLLLPPCAYVFECSGKMIFLSRQQLFTLNLRSIR